MEIESRKQTCVHKAARPHGRRIRRLAAGFLRESAVCLCLARPSISVWPSCSSRFQADLIFPGAETQGEPSAVVKPGPRTNSSR